MPFRRFAGSSGPAGRRIPVSLAGSPSMFRLPKAWRACRGAFSRPGTTAPFLVALLLVLPATPVCPAAGLDSAALSAGGPWSVRIARSFLLRHPGAVTYDSASPDTKWNYEQGLIL